MALLVRGRTLSLHFIVPITKKIVAEQQKQDIVEGSDTSPVVVDPSCFVRYIWDEGLLAMGT